MSVKRLSNVLSTGSDQGHRVLKRIFPQCNYGKGLTEGRGTRETAKEREGGEEGRMEGRKKTEEKVGIKDGQVDDWSDGLEKWKRQKDGWRKDCGRWKEMTDGLLHVSMATRIMTLFCSLLETRPCCSFVCSLFRNNGCRRRSYLQLQLLLVVVDLISACNSFQCLMAFYGNRDH